MPNKEVACILCGAFIDASEGLPHWLRDFRALFTEFEQWDAARISGVGRRHRDFDVIPISDKLTVPEPRSIVDGHWVQIELMRSRFNEPYPPPQARNPQPLWGFPLHARCWDLMCAFDPSTSSQSSIQALFDMARSHPHQYSLINWGHDYGGLAKYSKSPEMLWPGQDTRLAHRVDNESSFNHDPLAIPELEHLVKDTEPVTYRKHSPLVTRRGNDDSFRVLPHEILIEILVELGSQDIPNLQLASRTFASAGLPDRFWMSRFWPGRELHHMFEFNNPSWAPGRWEFVYREIKKHSTRIPAIINRARIWRLAHDMARLVRFRTNHQICEGPPDQIPAEVDRGRVWWTLIHPLTCPFDQGSRSLYQRMMTLSDSISSISVSLVVLWDKKTYISGLSIGSSRAGPVFTLGYYSPTSAVEVPFPSDQLDPAVEIQLARDPRGFRGLRVLRRSGALSPWVGDHEGIPKQSSRCNMPGRDSCLVFRAEFDALKMISASIDGDQNRVTPRLWYPEVPNNNLVHRGMYNPQKGFILPHYHCLFGGIDGQSIQNLTKITVWTIDRTSTGFPFERPRIQGLQFHYDSDDDGSKSKLLGLIPEISEFSPEVHEVILDSPGGERINRVDVMYPEPSLIFGFKLYTSHGKTYELPPGCSTGIDEEFYDLIIESLVPPRRLPHCRVLLHAAIWLVPHKFGDIVSSESWDYQRRDIAVVNSLLYPILEQDCRAVLWPTCLESQPLKENLAEIVFP